MQVGVRGVRKGFGEGTARVVALDGVDFEVPRSGTLALVGASGSGKSTLLHILGGLEVADAGAVTVGDVEVTGLRGRALVEHRRRVGFVFQAFNLLPGLTAAENVALPLLPYERESTARPKAAELLNVVGLGDRADALPGQLSGGQQQRVAIARALVNDPVLILADEPTGNLDSATAELVIDLLTRVRQERDAVLFVATHDQDVAARCDRVIRMRDGRVVSDTEGARG